MDHQVVAESGRRVVPAGLPGVGSDSGAFVACQWVSLQGTAKTLEGDQHPDRDAQFRYINEQVKQHQAAGQPVISVDAKKKEQLGLLPMGGQEWRPAGQPIEVEDHSFFAGRRVETVVP